MLTSCILLCSQADMPLIYANEAFARITGYSVAESLGKNCRFLQVSSAASPLYLFLNSSKSMSCSLCHQDLCIERRKLLEEAACLCTFDRDLTLRLSLQRQKILARSVFLLSAGA